MVRRLIGIGNPDRGDDAAGWFVAEAVDSWAVSQFVAGSFDMVDVWDAEDDVVMVDAMRSDAPVGEVRRFDALVEPLPVGAFTSTHAFGPAAVVELARVMGRMPRSLVVFGIEAGDTTHGASLSPTVAEATALLARELQNA
ncbi:MAG: hydrogenase maturation protease [Acidimicrobiia bacterium]